jgi:hypothetical protein
MKGLAGKSVAAVIYHQNQSDEELTAFIKETIIPLKDYFREIHIVSASKYEVPNTLNGITLFQHYDELSASLLCPETLLLVHFNTDQKLDENALVLLLESAQENRKRCDHYAIRGRIDSKAQNHSLQSSFLFGFVWFVTFIDYFRTLFNVWGYHTNEDLRATKVTPHFCAHPTVSEYKHAWFFSLFSRIASVQYHASLLITPRDDFYAFRFVRNHPHMSATNVQWWIFYTVYYVCFALPWWNLVLPNPGFKEVSVQSSIYIALYWFVYRNIYNPVWVFFWSVQIIALMLFVASRFKNANLSWVFLMPLYLTISPLFFLVSKNKKFK